MACLDDESFRGTPSLDADFNLSLTSIHVGLRGDSALGRPLSTGRVPFVVRRGCEGSSEGVTRWPGDPCCPG